MGAADVDRGLTGMGGLPSDRAQQQGPGGDSLAVVIGIGKPDEQGPPVEHQRNEPRHQAATLQVLGCEAAVGRHLTVRISRQGRGCDT